MHVYDQILLRSGRIIDDAGMFVRGFDSPVRVRSPRWASGFVAGTRTNIRKLSGGRGEFENRRFSSRPCVNINSYFLRNLGMHV